MITKINQTDARDTYGYFFIKVKQSGMYRLDEKLSYDAIDKHCGESAIEEIGKHSIAHNHRMGDYGSFIFDRHSMERFAEQCDEECYLVQYVRKADYRTEAFRHEKDDDSYFVSVIDDNADVYPIEFDEWGEDTEKVEWLEKKYGTGDYTALQIIESGIMTVEEFRDLNDNGYSFTLKNPARERLWGRYINKRKGVN